ncbi:hypothetical protein [Consotaella aegiceratis]|uniref:hypothetical protein n=1 Tax=Consotaella aegiceratis TaxID=3097961 RepID=UPI002F4242F6
MTSRMVLRAVHVVGGLLAFSTILLFSSATLAVEWRGDLQLIVAVKHWIAWCLLVLVPALAATGISGVAMTGARPNGLAGDKLARMKIIAPNGLLILVPAALYLNWKASQGQFDTNFAVVQAVELMAGVVNLTLLGLNIRDGLRMRGRLRRARA